MRWKAVLPAVAVVTALAACSAKEQPYEEVRPVRTMVVKQGDGSPGATLSGEVRARREARLGFRLGGKVAERMVEVGDRVRPGQALLRLDAQDTSLQLSASRSQYQQTRQDYERAVQLKSQGFVSQAEVDRRRAALDAAEAQFKLAGNQGSYTVLKAERAGVVTAVEAEVGQVVGAGQVLVRVAEDGGREVVVSVPESRVEELRRADKLAVTLWAVPGKRYDARLREMAPDTDPQTRTYTARVSIDNPDEVLRLGMTATVQVPGRSDSRTIRLPLTAIYDRDGQTLVWLVDPKTQRVATRKVTLAGAQNDVVLVAEGLSGGETVVTAGVHLLHPNQQVRLAQAPAPAAKPAGS
ncbi:efflux RND transporter periplasmic adaptor subunit [Chitinimonas lacunae]|uniref:Efflux RND transporter periplasmic adaptor subunit n=1 Tax=Chitinimonas lacunae TaxID=1963018 RepID=A0ABV8MRP5_9NEIS